MDKLVLLDSNSLLNRAFYALPPMSSVDGLPTNAVYGYVNMLLKIIKDANPTHIIATFDVKAPTFRKVMYPEYKAQRKGMPDELAAQLPLIKELLSAMNIQVIELAGFEADDLIGTLAKKCEFETIIVTGDKDSLQLISPSTTVWLTKRGITEIILYDEARLAEDGLTPNGVIHLKSLMGDASDNIPGVAGVGEKTAKKLLSDYGTLDGVYQHTDELKGKLKERIETSRDMAYLSYDLATINVNSPVDFVAEKCQLTMPFDVQVRELFKRFNFKSLINRFNYTGEVEEEIAKNTDFTEPNVIEVSTIDELNKLMELIKKSKSFALSIESDIHISVGDGNEYVVLIGHDLLSIGVTFDDVISALQLVIVENDIITIGYDCKSIMHQFNDIEQLNCQDLSIKIYLLDANRNYKNMKEAVLDYGCESDNSASLLYQLNLQLDVKLDDLKLTELYRNIELPLVKVLYDIERAGCRVDLKLLDTLKVKFTDELRQLTLDIYEFNKNEQFNINSPKQLGEFLFERLGLKHGKKTKTGYSTDVAVLNSLINESPVIRLILRYREINKLLSTYIDGLTPLLVGDRVHTIFKQTVTSTGRLSSTEPNLQNIPVRRDEGRELRKMFIASDGCKLLCADYSQIELRLLAHLSGDKVLTDAFRDGVDIHLATASRAFNVPLNEVTSDMRRKAKAVNFGIIYGISSFGLANDIGVSPFEAKQFIDKYFEMYPAVKGFMDKNIEIGKEDGYISTLLGRIRFVPELKSTNFNIRSFGERIAMNMPLQGSASDIIKKAMIDVSNALYEGKYKAKLILQVHDELLIDCPLDEVENVSKLLGDCMQNTVKLDVSLDAEVSVGDNWLEAK